MRRNALTLIEVVFSTMIVAVMTVVALDALGAATRSSVSASNRAIALGLADDLMAVIRASSYGDLNDYANFSEDLTGDRVGWTRNATVQRVQPANPTQAAPGATDLGAKRIRVFVEFEDGLLAEQYAICTDSE